MSIRTPVIDTQANVNRHDNGALKLSYDVPSQGFAVVMVLVIVAILSLFMASTISRNNQMQLRTIGMVNQQQARTHLLASEDWIEEILVTDAEDSSYDDLDEPWAQAVPFIPIQGGVLSGQVSDLSGKVNVNSLYVKNSETPDPVWQALLEALLPSQYKNTNLTWYLYEWLDTNLETRQFDLEDNWYLSQPNAYRSANYQLLDISELRNVRGFEPELYETLLDSLYAAPIASDRLPKININTAPENVLAALLTLIDSPTLSVEQMIEDRPWEDVADIPLPTIEEGVPPKLINANNIRNYVSVSSHYFLADVNATVDEQSSRMQSVLERYKKDDEIVIKNIKRQWLPGI